MMRMRPHHRRGNRPAPGGAGAFRGIAVLLATLILGAGCHTPLGGGGADEPATEVKPAGEPAGSSEGETPSGADPAEGEAVQVSADALMRRRRAQEALRAEKYTAAIRSARWAYQIGETRELRGEALFVEGEALFLREDYYASHSVFERILDRYPRHRRFREAVAREHQVGTLLLKGRDPGRFLWFRTGREAEGVQILERIVEEFPAERFAEDSQFLIASFYFGQEEYERAKTAYMRLYDDFPASKWAAISLFKTGECHRVLSRGPRYDWTPLEKAKKIYEKYIERHPRGDKVPDAEARISEIHTTFADEEYNIARSYLREGKYRSAEVYLRSIIYHYPETESAQIARETLRSLDLPIPEPGRRRGQG